MTLTNTAYLVLEDDTSTATFELNIGLEPEGQLEKSYIMAGRGQYIREVFNQSNLTGTVEDVADRRSGFYIDGGAGTVTETLSFSTALEDVQWGDGSGGDGPTNVTRRDASGADVKAVQRKDILEFWINNTLTDSRNLARVHFGEWTDGNVENITTTISEGAFGIPKPVAVSSYQTQITTGDEYQTLTGSLTLEKVAPFAGNLPTWLENTTYNEYVTNAAESLGVISDE